MLQSAALINFEWPPWSHFLSGSDKQLSSSLLQHLCDNVFLLKSRYSWRQMLTAKVTESLSFEFERSHLKWLSKQTEKGLSLKAGHWTERTCVVSALNQNEMTNQFRCTVFHDSVGRSSDETHNQKREDHRIISGRGGRKGLAQCQVTQSSDLGMAGSVGNVQGVWDGRKWKVCKEVWAMSNTKYKGGEMSIRMQEDEWHRRLKAGQIKFILVPALWDEFCSSVQRAFFVSRDDLQLLSQAQVTPFGGVLVIRGFPLHTPLMSYSILEDPDVLWQRCAAAAFAVPHWMLIRVVMLLEGLCSQASVFLPVARHCDGRFVHHWLHLARAMQLTVFLDAAVAWPSILANGSSTLEDRAVMLPDHSCHIGHTTAAQLYRVCFEDFREFRVSWKVLANESVESSTDVCWNILAVQRFEPGNISTTVYLFSLFAAAFPVLVGTLFSHKNRCHKKEYTGLTAQTFKQRYHSHQHLMRDNKYRDSTSLSKHVLALKDQHIDYNIKWSVLWKAMDHYAVGNTSCTRHYGEAETSGRQSLLVSPPEYSTIHRYKVWLESETWVKKLK